MPISQAEAESASRERALRRILEAIRRKAIGEPRENDVDVIEQCRKKLGLSCKLVDFLVAALQETQRFEQAVAIDTPAMHEERKAIQAAWQKLSKEAAAFEIEKGRRAESLRQRELAVQLTVRRIIDAEQYLAAMRFACPDLFGLAADDPAVRGGEDYPLPPGLRQVGDELRRAGEIRGPKRRPAPFSR